ncbi:MAG: hypothetical protein ACP5JG_18725 [Anaerolineae bacterium]
MDAKRPVPAPAGRENVEIQDQRAALVKVYLIVGWAALVLLAIVSGLVYRRVAVSHLIYEMEGQALAVAQPFVNRTWPEVRSFVRGAAELDVDVLRSSPAVTEIGEALGSLAEGLPVVGVKLYNQGGLIVYATQAAEIGKTTTDPLVLEMTAGQWYGDGRRDARSDLVPVESIAAGDASRRGTRLITTQVALRRSNLRDVEGVLEIRQDATADVQRITRIQWIAVGSMVALVTLILAALYLRRRELGDRPTSAAHS